MAQAASELIELERRFWQAMKDRDVDAALELTAEPCIVTGAQGVAKIDKQTFAKMMQGGEWELKSFDLTDVQVERVTDDVAVVGYKVHEELQVEGKPLTMEAADASTWVRQDGRWVCAMHSESLLGDPYGRDRTKPGGAYVQPDS
jgi:ketosteroid isomerase-like protein